MFLLILYLKRHGQLNTFCGKQQVNVNCVRKRQQQQARQLNLTILRKIHYKYKKIFIKKQQVNKYNTIPFLKKKKPTAYNSSSGSNSRLWSSQLKNRKNMRIILPLTAFDWVFLFLFHLDKIFLKYRWVSFSSYFLYL